MAELFGHTKKGRHVDQISITNKNGMRAVILTYGAALQSLWVPDREGNLADVVLGFDSVAGYEADRTYLGVVVGRVAGRVTRAEFSLLTEHEQQSTTCRLTKNSGDCCLHGGERGLSKRVWTLDRSSLRMDCVTLMLVSKDGDEGFPGMAEFAVTFRITTENELEIDYTAVCSASCPINMTNHSYFNLAGHGTPDIYDHVVSIKGDRMPKLGKDLVPSGEVTPISGPFDLRTPKTLTRELVQSVGQDPPGYDGYWVFEDAIANGDEVTARVEHPPSGRIMEMTTNQPGVQFYTANFLDGAPGKSSKPYPRHSALCLEAQNWPDAMNHATFPDITLHPGKTYSQLTKYRFSIA